MVDSPIGTAGGANKFGGASPNDPAPEYADTVRLLVDVKGTEVSSVLTAQRGAVALGPLFRNSKVHVRWNRRTNAITTHRQD